MFDVKRHEIAEWFNGRKVGATKGFDVKSPLGLNRSLGKTFTSGASEFADAYSVVVVLKKVSGTEFRILTAYPNNKVK